MLQNLTRVGKYDGYRQRQWKINYTAQLLSSALSTLISTYSVIWFNSVTSCDSALHSIVSSIKSILCSLVLSTLVRTSVSASCVFFNPKFKKLQVHSPQSSPHSVHFPLYTVGTGIRTLWLLVNNNSASCDIGPRLIAMQTRIQITSQYTATFFSHGILDTLRASTRKKIIATIQSVIILGQKRKL